MEADRVNQIEKLYTVLIGLTVAFLAVSFANATRVEPVHVLWLITLFLVARDWLDSTGYEFLCTSKWHYLISLIYILLLMVIPLALRFIEESMIPVFVYPLGILTITIVSLIFLLSCFKHVKICGYVKADKLRYAGYIAQDILAIIIYAVVLLISIMWLPIYLSWLHVIIFACAIMIFENFIDRLFVSYLTKWIQYELLSAE